MNDEKCCCNCLHNARWKTSKGVECHCDLDDKYLGYLTVMNTDINCDKWEKETKWDIQAEHDKQIRADAIDEFKKCFYEHAHFEPWSMKFEVYQKELLTWLEQLKEHKND